MSNYQYSRDIRDDVLDRADELIDGTSPYQTTVETYVNRQYLAICLGGREIHPDINEAWWWLRKSLPGTLVLQTPYTTGTVNVANGSASITFSGTIAASQLGKFFQVTGHPDIFRIAAHTGGSASATLDAVYTGSDDSTAAYALYQYEYTLASDVLRPISPMYVDRQNTNNDPYKIYLIDHDVMERDWPRALVPSGIPEYFSIINQGTTGTSLWTVRFNRRGNDTAGDLVRIEYDYLQRPGVLAFGASEELLIPWEYRHIVAEAALYLLFLQKNDSRADSAGLAARAGLEAMAKDQRQVTLWAGPETGQIIPRQSYRRWGRIWRYSDGAIVG